MYQIRPISEYIFIRAHKKPCRKARTLDSGSTKNMENKRNLWRGHKKARPRWPQSIFQGCHLTLWKQTKKSWSRKPQISQDFLASFDSAAEFVIRTKFKCSDTQGQRNTRENFKSFFSPAKTPLQNSTSYIASVVPKQQKIFSFGLWQQKKVWWLGDL